MSKNILVEGWRPMDFGQVDQKIKCVSVPLIVGVEPQLSKPLTWFGIVPISGKGGSVLTGNT